MNEFQREFDGLMDDKKESENALTLGINSFANEIKNGLGDEIKKELLNPTIKPIKKSRKEKRREWWNSLKERLNAYFFPENNEIL